MLDPRSNVSAGQVVALIAHDAKKHDLIGIGERHRQLLARTRLVATGATGALLQRALGLQVECMTSGLLGGDLQVGALIAEGCVDAVIFLRDPLTAQPHEPDLHALLKVCDVHEVPIATNLAAAELLLSGLQQAAGGFRSVVEVSGRPR